MSVYQQIVIKEMCVINAEEGALTVVFVFLRNIRIDGSLFFNSPSVFTIGEINGMLDIHLHVPTSKPYSLAERMLIQICPKCIYDYLKRICTVSQSERLYGYMVVHKLVIYCPKYTPFGLRSLSPHPKCSHCSKPLMMKNKHMAINIDSCEWNTMIGLPIIEDLNWGHTIFPARADRAHNCLSRAASPIRERKRP